MKEEGTNPDRVRRSWYIDFDWYQSNRRSFFNLAQGCLCSKCRRRLKVEAEEVAAADLLSAVKDCCSKKSGFIPRESPVMESIFRLFLANGNQPLDIEELGRQLGERRGGSPSRTSVEVLSRLLEHDRYYGLRPVESGER